jgi:hypothetical protein
MNHPMNNKDLLDKAVEQFDGKWPAVNVHHTYLKVSGNKNVFYNYQTKFDFSQYAGSNGYWDLVCSKEVFEQRAKELGYVNGYRWGVEYELDGKGPDLPDDTLIVWTDAVDSAETTCHGMNWVGVESFRITDPRYKPADTSYLDAPVVNKAKSLLEMLNDLSEIELAAVKDSDEAKKLVAYLEGIEHKRKAEAERKRVVDAAYKVYSDTTKDSYQAFIELYDMGMLVMPSKSSQD